MKIREIQRVRMEQDASRSGGGGIHPFDEILSLLEGEARLEWMGTTYYAVAPALFLLPANTPHHFTAATNHCEYGYMELDIGNVNNDGSVGSPKGDRASDGLTGNSRWSFGIHAAEAFSISRARMWNDLQDKGTAFEGSGARDAVMYVHRQMWDSYPWNGIFGEISNELIIRDVHKLLLMIRHYLTSKEQRERKPESKNQWMTDGKGRLLHVIRQMESAYQQNLVVSELALQANMELNHFIRSFKKMTGKPPLQYLQELRLHAACSYLRTTNMPIHAVAQASGIPDLHYFSKLFKKRYGHSPTAYRAEWTNE